MDPSRLNVGQGRTTIASGHVAVEFAASDEDAEISQPIRFTTPDARIASGVGIRVRLRGWKKISYIGIGHTEDGAYRHVKATHPRQDHWFDFCVGFRDLAWGWRNNWDRPEDRPVQDIRFYIKGIPGPGAGLDISDLYLWQEAGEPDAVFGAGQPVPEAVNQSLLDYNRAYFRDYPQQAKAFMEDGKCPLSGNVLLDWPMTAPLPPDLGDNGTYQYSWHSQHPALMLMLAGIDRNQVGPVFAARELVTGWLDRSYDMPDPNVKYAWYDHGVAERVLTFVTLYALGQEHGFDIRFMTRLRRAIHRHAQLLASEVFYAGHQPIRHHNHAWFQDLALMAVGLAFPGWACAGHWIDTALERITDQFAQLIVRDGDYAVFAENSIGYHLGIERLVSNVGLFARLSGRQTDIPAIISGLSAFSDQMRYPDGKRVPAQGDTFRQPNPPDGDPQGRSPHAQDTVTILPHAGYGIVKANHAGRPFALIFLATSLSATHKHADNLSFTLYLDGIEWLIDPSFLSHEYGQAIPRYLRGPAAHNAFVLPDAPYAITPGLAALSGRRTDRGFRFDGQHSAVPGCLFRRSIEGATTELALQFADELRADAGGTIQPSDARLMFHCGEGVTVAQDGAEVRLTHPASDLAVILSLPPGSTIRFFQGQEDGPTRGITGLGFLQTRAITTIEIEAAQAGQIRWTLRAVPKSEVCGTGHDAGRRDNAAPPAGQPADDLSALIRKGALLRNQKRPQEALAWMQDLNATHPGNPRILHELALIWRQIGDRDASLRFCDDLLALDPQHRGAHLIRTEALMMRGQPFEAGLDAVETALRLFPDDLTLLTRKATFLRGLQRPQEALAWLRVLRAAHPGDARILYELVLARRQIGDHDTSLHLCDELLVLDPQHRGAHLIRTEALMRAESFEVGLDAVETALRLFPDDLTLLTRKATFLRRLQRPQEALAWLRDLDAEYPGDIRILSETALVWRLIGDDDASLRVYDEMLAIDPQHRGTHLARAEVLMQGNDPAALESLAVSACGTLRGEASEYQRITAGQVFFKLLPGLPSAVAERLLTQTHRELAEIAPHIGSLLLWRAYVQGDLLGLGRETAPLAAEILGRDSIEAATAREMVARIFQINMPDWHGISQYIAEKVPAEDRPEIELEINTLRHGAAHALKHRHRNAASRKSEKYILLVSRLKKQIGQAGVAARYAGLACRANRNNHGIFLEHVVTLVMCGRDEQARQVLEDRSGHAAGLPDVWLAAIAFCWVTLDRADRARDFMDQVRNRKLLTASRWYPAVMIRLGETEQAIALIDSARTASAGKAALHLNPSIQGLIQAEAAISTIDSGTNPSLVTPAVRYIENWLKQPGPPVQDRPGTRIPRQIVQYWDRRVPPADIRPIMKSWEDLPGFGYHRFNRAEAIGFLHRELGCDWESAFRRAGSPAEESDFFRLCHLMLKGGIYADCDDWHRGDLDPLLRDGSGLIVFREFGGVISNNFLMAAPRHPALVWAASAARRALHERHTDSTWSKTGPGLLVRAVAWYLERSRAEKEAPDITILPRHVIGRYVQEHTPLPYKSSLRYWNAAAASGSLTHFHEKSLCAMTSGPQNSPDALRKTFSAAH